MFIPDKTTKHRLPADLRYVNDCKVFTEGVYLDNVVQPDTVFVEALLSDSSVQCFAEKASNYFEPYLSLNDFNMILSARKDMFEREFVNLSIEHFIVIAPFILGFYSRSGKYQPYLAEHVETGLYGTYFNCRRKNCRYIVRVYINREERLIQFFSVGQHNHDISDLISDTLCPYARKYVCFLAKSRSDRTPACLLKDAYRNIGYQIAQSLGLCAASNSDISNIIMRRFHGISDKYVGTGSTEKDVSEAINWLREVRFNDAEEPSLWVKPFRMGSSKGFVLADKIFFQEMVFEQPVLLLDSTHNVTSQENSKLMSLAYRGTDLKTRVGATAYYVSNESTEDVTNVLQAIKSLAHVFSKRIDYVFSHLAYIVTDESSAERCAIRNVFPNTKNLLCVWHKKVNFQKQIIGFDDARSACNHLIRAMNAYNKDLFDSEFQLVLFILKNAQEKEEKKNEPDNNKLKKIGTTLRYVRRAERDKERWALYFRAEYPTLMQLKSTQRIESIHSVFKRTETKGGFHINSGDVPQTLAKKLAFFFQSAHEKIKLINRRASNQNRFFTNHHLPELDKLDPQQYILCRCQYEQALRFKRYCDKQAHTKRRRGRPKSVKAIVESKTTSRCEAPNMCFFFQQYQLPCKHIFLNVLNNGYQAIDTHHFLETAPHGSIQNQEERLKTLALPKDEINDGHLRNNRLFDQFSNLSRRFLSLAYSSDNEPCGNRNACIVEAFMPVLEFICRSGEFHYEEQEDRAWKFEQDALLPVADAMLKSIAQTQSKMRDADFQSRYKRQVINEIQENNNDCNTVGLDIESEDIQNQMLNDDDNEDDLTLRFTESYLA